MVFLPQWPVSWSSAPGLSWIASLSTEMSTVGDMLRKAGYYTAYKGKWHLTKEFETVNTLGTPTKIFTQEMEAYGFSDYVGIGSSLKFCIVAEGAADIYPRLSPTCEWDTAAGHAVLLAAGGRVDGPEGDSLRYGKPAFFNRGFVATAGWAAPAIGPFLAPFTGGGDLPEGL